ncbi:hypothetical protein STEG23_009355, partial [Scotinomys teguina]
HRHCFCLTRPPPTKRRKKEDRIAQDTTQFGQRKRSNQVCTDQEMSSLLATSHSVRSTIQTAWKERSL